MTAEGIRKWAAAAFLALSALGQPAWADRPASQAEAAGILKAASSQMLALERGDARALFEGASPEVRAQYGTPESLLAVAAKAWPVRPGMRQATFHPPAIVEGAGVVPDSTAVQAVNVVGLDGRAWVVVFALELQPDGEWRISGAVAAEAGGGRKAQEV